MSKKYVVAYSVELRLTLSREDLVLKTTKTTLTRYASKD